jgi:hypothetical protein
MSERVEIKAITAPIYGMEINLRYTARSGLRFNGLDAPLVPIIWACAESVSFPARARLPITVNCDVPGMVTDLCPLR